MKGFDQALSDNGLQVNSSNHLNLTWKTYYMIMAVIIS